MPRLRRVPSLALLTPRSRRVQLKEMQKRTQRQDNKRPSTFFCVHGLITAPIPFGLLENLRAMKHFLLFYTYTHKSYTRYINICFTKVQFKPLSERDFVLILKSQFKCIFTHHERARERRQRQSVRHKRATPSCLVAWHGLLLSGRIAPTRGLLPLTSFPLVFRQRSPWRVHLLSRRRQARALKASAAAAQKMYNFQSLAQKKKLLSGCGHRQTSCPGLYPSLDLSRFINVRILRLTK